MNWHVYLVRCRDNTLYCGVSNDVENRVKAHNSAKRGAKYTRGRQPVQLVWKSPPMEMRSACSYECDVKDMSKAAKEKMIKEAQDGEEPKETSSVGQS